MMNLLISQYKQSQMNNQIDGKIYNITIQADIIQATTAVKFPCLFYILWKTNDQKSIAETGKCAPHAEKVQFQQTITLKTTTIYERNKQIFLKKQTQVQLNLISKSRPDQPKLVGRVTIDIATLLNQHLYTTPTLFPLQFCSVNAHLLASFKIIQKIETDISLYELQKSFGDNVTFTSGLKGFTPTSLTQKNRDSFPFSNDSPSIKSRPQQVNGHFKQVSIASMSPNVTNGVKDIITKEPKQTSTTIKDIRVILQDTNKSRSKSFKSPINTQQSQNNLIRKQQIEQLKKSDDSIKLKNELDQLKLENTRKAQQQQRSRLQLQKRSKDIQFVKIQLRQKQALLDQATAQNTIIRSQTHRLREEAAKAREQASRAREETASMTIKLAQLKDNYNRSNLQLTALERDLKRYENVNENLQQTSQSKRELSNQLSQLSKQLGELENKLSRTQKQKGELQEYIKIKQSQFKKKSDDWTQQKSSQSNQKQSLLVQLSYAQEQIKNQAILRSGLETKIGQYEKQITRLTAIEHQFQEAQHSWEIKQSILNEDLSRRTTRLTELEQTLLALGERVRWLEGENQLLTQNCRLTREQHLKFKEQTNLLQAQTTNELQKTLQDYNQLKTDYHQLQEKNVQIQNNLNSIISNYQTLSADHTTLSNDHIQLIRIHSQLNGSWKEQKQKSSQLEQLLLIGNEQRQRQSTEASNRQAQCQNKILSLQNELVIIRQQLLIGQQRISILDLEIKNRQDLITKLQDSLNVQIERIQSFNARLLRYLEKQQRMKDIIMFMEQQHRSLLQLINQFQNSENNYKLTIQSKDIHILELINQIQKSINQRKSLQTLIGQRQNSYKSQTQNLLSKLAEQEEKMKYLENQLFQGQKLSSNIQKQLKENEISFKQKIEQYQKILNDQKQTANLLNYEKTQLENQFQRMQSNIASLNAALSQKQNQVKIHKENELLLNQQIFIKQTQQNESSKKIKQLSQKIQQLNTQITDLQNQILLKQQIIKEQNNRFNQLDSTYQNLINDQANFDLNRHKQELKEKIDDNEKLKTEVSRLQTQVSKIPSIERSLKIKTIELSSIKSKGKGQFSQTNELIRLKDEQISSLQTQKQKLLSFEQQCLKLSEQITILKCQLQIAQQERFNIESQSNEKALYMEELKEENRKLLQEITIIGEKHGELQKIVAEMMSGDSKDPNIKSQTSLKAQNLILKSQTRENEQLKAKVNQLQQSRNKLMQQIETKQKQYKTVRAEGPNEQNATENNRLGQSISQKTVINSSDKSKASNINDVYKSLKQLIDERNKVKLNGTTKQILNKTNRQETSKIMTLQKIKTISKNFTLLKVQLMRAGEIKNQLQRTKLINQLQICEGIITTFTSEN